MQLRGTEMESTVAVKGGKIRSTNMERLVLSLPDGTGEVRVAFNELIAPESPLQQISAVEKLSALSLMSDDQAELCISILTSALLQLNPKVQLRNKIFKTLPSMGCNNPDLYKETVLKVVMAGLTDPKTPRSVVFGASLLVEGNGALLMAGSGKEKKGKGDKEKNEEVEMGEQVEGKTGKVITAELHPFVFGALLKGISQLWHGDFLVASSTAEASTVLQHLQQLVKSSTMYVQQHFSDGANDIPQELHSLKDAVLEVIQHPSCPLDLRTNCGQLVATITKTLHKGNLQQVLQSYHFDEEQSQLPTLAQLALLNGILSISQGRDLYVQQECGTCLGAAVLQAVLRPAMQSNDGSIAVSVIRVVHQWTLRTLEAFRSPGELEMLKKVLDPSSGLMVRFLEYMWLAWDHFLDSVKNATKDSFVNYMKIQQSLSVEVSGKHFLGVCKTLLEDLCSRKFRFSAVSCMVPVVGAQNILLSYPQLPCTLLNQLRDPAIASHSAELLEALFTKHQKEVSLDEWQDLWLSVFLDLFSKDMQTYGYELLFKKLLFTCPEALSVAVKKLVELAKNPVSEKLCLLIMCVKIGRCSPHWLKKCQQNDKESDEQMWKSILPYETIKLCLWHTDESVRTAAFSLLCESPKSTELPEKEELEFIYDYYLYNLTTQSPAYRQHLLKSTKKLFLRIKEGTMALTKSSKSKGDKDNGKEILTVQQEFCSKLFWQMVQNLYNGANSMRRTMSLQVLELFQSILSGCYNDLGISKLYQSKVYADTLISVLDDSYETNKVIALMLLQSIPKECENTEDTQRIHALVKAACSLTSTCRPPDTITAGYLFKYLSSHPLAISIVKDSVKDTTETENSVVLFCKFVLQFLQKEVKTAEESLLKAASSGPMYGLLLCVRMLLSDIPEADITKHHQTWQEILKMVLQLCFQVSELVAPVVRNSSPEGHLPMDLNPESLEVLRATLQQSLGNHHNEQDVMLSAEATPQELVKAQAVSAQMLLLCAWRCVKEISLILGDVVQKMPLSPQANAVLTNEDVVMIGQYFITQLLETKHRGAFEQSYVGFGRVCERLWSCKEEELRKLPAVWLEDLLATIQDESDTRLCATRRSAGVPFIVQAVLSSEPKMMGASCLKNTMSTLLQLAGETHYSGSEAKIHSFNILRAVYKDTRLGDFIIPYVSQGVKAAIEGYRGNSWAERNSAALLFAALITRMLGVKRTQDDLSRKNAMSAQVFFKRYPELYDFLKMELENGAVGVKEGKLVPALFPVLLLLARLAPAPLEGRTSAISLASFTPAVLQCSASSVLQLRALASHALIPLVNPHQLEGVIEQISASASLSNQNALHGCLLCLLKLVKNFEETVCNPCNNRLIIKSLMTILWAATKANACLVTRSSALELYTLLAQTKLLQESSEVAEVSSDACIFIKTNDLVLQSMPWSALCQKQATRFLLTTAQNLEEDHSISLKMLISHDCYEVRLSTLEHVEGLTHLEAPILIHLLSCIHTEDHPECLSLVYSILSKHLSSLDHGKEIIGPDQLMKLVGHIISIAKEETCLELMTRMIQLSSVLMIALLSRETPNIMEEAVHQWLEMILSFSQSENDADTRQTTAEAVCNVLPHLISHPCVTDKIRLVVYEIMTTELQDDSDIVRDTVSYGVSELLKQQHQEKQQFYLQPTRVMEKVCGLIASCKWPEASSLLVKLSLKEDLPEGFGLAQEDDRVFDKGEMNIYSEKLIVMQATLKALSDVLTSNSFPSASALTFLRSHVIPFLCSPTVTQDKIPEEVSQEEELLLSLSQLLSVLEYDICYIYEQITALKDTALFCVRHVDLWLMRLSCRSAIWAKLSPLIGRKSSSVKLVVEGLNQSVLKNSFLCQIIEELSSSG
ncbi:thyroid adenoma-associated protein homolog isoform X2 [Penaeus japonicus]|uniref:thyroid adenoma-associated protein homolog isoform X2 n=1 Tax=Penaeus japonicus TaxID=27405 RepID=UPI001C715AC1|nr:thyroid adenoma-associated protein homolog isoform X2 [Penaeus japonicus]